MGKQAGLKISSGFLGFLILSLMAATAHAAETGRKQIAPSEHPLGKIVIQVGQVGADPMFVGNGFVVGSDACHVLTNFHVAFGKGRKPNGDVEFIDTVQPGHVVEVGVDLNPKTGSFMRKSGRGLLSTEITDKTINVWREMIWLS